MFAVICFVAGENSIGGGSLLPVQTARILVLDKSGRGLTGADRRDWRESSVVPEARYRFPRASA
jgi:hypothetical protein